MKNKYNIFFSYSHRDSAIARHIVSRFEDSGLKCFIAEKDISAGEQWEASIKTAINSSDRMIILITPRSKNSLWVAAEAGVAWALEKELIAGLMFVETNELIEPIRKHQARMLETPEQIEALVNELVPQNKNDLIIDGLISGQWVDPEDGDVVFFKQVNNKIVGFYDYATGKRKVGIYIGKVKKSVFNYEWKWLSGQPRGKGQMRLSVDCKRLSGEWWYESKKITEPVEYHRVSKEMPAWLKESDFKDYLDFLKE